MRRNQHGTYCWRRSAPQQAGTDRAYVYFRHRQPACAADPGERPMWTRSRRSRISAKTRSTASVTVIEDEGNVEGDLRKDVSMHIKRLIEIQSTVASAIAALAGARPAHPHQRPHPQGSAQGHRRGQEESNGEDLMAKPRKGRCRQSWQEQEVQEARAQECSVWHLVHIQASFNNTIVTITDQEGNTLCWKSSGSLGFRGSRKGTPFAAQQAALNAANHGA